MTMKKVFLFFLTLLLIANLDAQTAIHTGDELLSISLSGQYYLANDIELDQWTPLGEFTGSLDGRGHCIRVATGTPDALGYGGLFAATNGAVLRNLIIGGTFSGASEACGSLVGRAVNTYIENCETEAVLLTDNPSAVMGGLVGVMSGGSMSNCSSNASMEGVLLGGLVGSVLDNAKVQNCYSSASFAVPNADTEVGYLAHDNKGVLENNYVRMLEEGWWIASIGQLCMMYAARTIMTNRNNGLLANWGNGYCMSSTMLRLQRIVCIDAYHVMYSFSFGQFNSPQGGQVRFVHDVHGVGYNIGDIVYVGGVKCFVFYLYEDGLGGWVTPLEDTHTNLLLSSKDNDALNGYYLTTGVYINALEVDYAQGHDGHVVHGAVVNAIPAEYRGNTGKFYTYTLRQNDSDPTHQVNQLHVAGNGTVSTTLIKQLAFENTGTIQNCYYPMDTADYGLVAEGTTENCCRYEELHAPYGYGEYGSWLDAGDHVMGATLADSLNAWVNRQGSPFCTWSDPCNKEVNANLPIHRYDFHNGQGTVNTAVRLPWQGDQQALRYADLNTLPATYRTEHHTLAYYGNQEGINADNITDPWEAPLYLTEDATLKGNYALTAHVAITLDNSDGSALGGKPYDWHSFSTSLADAPVGISYENYQNGGPEGAPSEVSFVDENGYFPLDTPYASWDFYCYDEPNTGWPNFKRNTGDHYHSATGAPIYYENEASLVPGKGYLGAIDRKTTLQAYGSLNNGPIQCDMTRQGELSSGYNLIGNPYQAYLDFDAFCSDNSEALAQQAYTLLDADKQGYITYCPGTSNNPNYAPRYLHPHQGFFVQAKTDQSTVTFDPDQTTVTPLSAFRDGVIQAEKKDHPLLNLTVTDSHGEKDYATVEFGHEQERGVRKMEGLHAGNGVLSFGHQGNAYSILLLENCPRQIPVRFSAMTDGVYTLHWQALHTALKELRLIDHLTGTEVDGLQTDHYTFTARTDDYASRFAVVFEPAGLDEEYNLDGPFALPSATGWEVLGEGSLELFDLLGRKVYATPVTGPATTVRFPELPSGVYLLRLVQRNGVRTQKIILQ